VIETEKKAREEAMVRTSPLLLSTRLACIWLTITFLCLYEIEQVACQFTRSTYSKTSWVLEYLAGVFSGKHRHYWQGNILCNLHFIEYSAAI
jgi:hypothetical protein